MCSLDPMVLNTCLFGWRFVCLGMTHYETKGGVASLKFGGDATPESSSHGVTDSVFSNRDSASNKACVRSRCAPRSAKCRTLPTYRSGAWNLSDVALEAISGTFHLFPLSANRICELVFVWGVQGSWRGETILVVYGTLGAD